ncbi:Phosphoethanolamine N-methyltransferase [Diplogelasinospora grovesii]|uniref:Phosphoethanolamine N-methyltransferase n=1 Tax=Diplogelasinospora grovesii TaxID=303347 RepID=A0AAN6S9R9_9PEZI|nr:Phosphoethanolamine N-methyltransferase [Diplogelasinospora grovesii]
MADSESYRPTRGPASSPPSSASTSIIAGLGTTPEEEELYAAAGAGRPRVVGSSPASPKSGTGPPPSSSSGPAGSGSRVSARESSSLGANADFDFDADMSRYPASMTSSVRAHVYEGGLRYHAFRDGKYAFPNDETEQNRDDMKHTMSLMLCRGSYFYSPVEQILRNGGEVLDLGTGTGIWAIEVGDRYPAAQITGIDLSPIQPNFVPENVHFFVDDFEEEWVDPENKYDFIHVRFTVYSIRDRKLFLQRALRHLKPGGYIEIQELHFFPHCDDQSMTPQTPYAFRDYMNYMEDGIRALGSDLHAILLMSDELKQVGFEDVTTTTHKCPIGLWPRDKRLRLCGLFLRTAIMDGLRGLSRRPLTNLGWTQLQIEMFLVDVRKAVMDAKFHTYFPFHVLYGRKPLS